MLRNALYKIPAFLKWHSLISNIYDFDHEKQML